jgi:hypothetical protein
VLQCSLNLTPKPNGPSTVLAARPCVAVLLLQAAAGRSPPPAATESFLHKCRCHRTAPLSLWPEESRSILKSQNNKPSAAQPAAASGNAEHRTAPLRSPLYWTTDPLPRRTVAVVWRPPPAATARSNPQDRRQSCGLCPCRRPVRFPGTEGCVCLKNALYKKKIFRHIKLVIHT